MCYLCKVILHDYEIIKKIPENLIAKSILFVGFKILEQIYMNFNLDEIVSACKNFKSKIFLFTKMPIINNLLKVSSEVVFNFSIVLLNFAQNFDKIYPNILNLIKNHGNIFDALEKKKKFQTIKKKLNF